MVLNDRERDAIGRLPEAARLKFWKLNSQAEALGEAARNLTARQSEIRSAIQSEEAYIAGLGGATPGPERRAVKQASEARIEAFQQEARDLASSIDHETRATLVGLINRSVSVALNVPHGRCLKAAIRREPVMRRGESPAAAVERCRSEIAKAREEIEMIESAPLPSALAIERARDEIERLAAHGAPNLSQIVLHGSRNIHWPDSAHRNPIENVASLIAWFDKERLLEAVKREIMAIADDAAAIAPADKASKIGNLQAQIAELERDEVGLIEIAARQGIAIGLRDDLSIHALLGLSEELTAAKPEAPYELKSVSPRSARL